MYQERRTVQRRVPQLMGSHSVAIWVFWRTLPSSTVSLHIRSLRILRTLPCSVSPSNRSPNTQPHHLPHLTAVKEGLTIHKALVSTCSVQW